MPQAHEIEAITVSRELRPLIVVQPFLAFLFFVIRNVDEVQDRVDVGGFGREIKLTG